MAEEEQAKEPQAREGQSLLLKKKLTATIAARRAGTLAPEDIQTMNLQLRALARPIILSDADPTDDAYVFDLDPTDRIIVIHP